MTEEARYTEAEWRQRDAELDCLHGGHDYDVTSVRDSRLRERPISIRCTTCRRSWSVAAQPPSSEASITSPDLSSRPEGDEW